MAQITRRNFLEVAGAAGLLGALAACDTQPAEETPASEGSETEPEPETEPEAETEPEPEPEGPQPHDLSEYPLDPDGDDVEALWSEEVNQRDGFTLVTNEGGNPVGYATEGGAAIIQVDGFAFKDLNGNGKLDVYEDWRFDPETRAQALAETMTAEEIVPLLYHTNMGSSAPLSDMVKNELNNHGRAAVSRTSLTENNYVTLAEWVNSMQAMCEGMSDFYGIPYMLSVDPYSVLGIPDFSGVVTSFDRDIWRKSGMWRGRVWRASGVTVLLGPQVDVYSNPIGSRLSGSVCEDPATNRDFTSAFCGGMQSTWGDNEATEDLGWGTDSVAAMIKHYCGAGAVEGGRNDHSNAGKYNVFPGMNYEAHFIPFIDGGMNLDSVTGQVASVMTNYGVAFTEDEEYGEHVAGAYNKFAIDKLRENAGWDGMICTDWGVVADANKPWGMYDYTVAERHAEIWLRGSEQIGGEFTWETGLEGIAHLEDELGEDGALELLQHCAKRIFTVMNKVQLFDQPYIDREHAKEILESEEGKAFGLEATKKSIVMIKNADGVIKEGGIEGKPKAYVPMKAGAFDFMSWMSGGAGTSAPELSLNEEVANELFDVVTDDVDADNNIITIDYSEIADCKYAFLNISGPTLGEGSSYDSGNSSTDYSTPDHWLPMSLQYSPYTADGPNVKKVSLGGDRAGEKIMGRDGIITVEEDENRSYYGNSSGTDGTATIEQVKAIKEAMTDGKLIVYVGISNPMIFAEIEPYCDVIMLGMGLPAANLSTALGEILSGEFEPQGLLAWQMPKDMDTVEANLEDVPRDVEPYEDSEGNVYDFAFGLNWSGVIDDDRVATYSVEPLTKLEYCEF